MDTKIDIEALCQERGLRITDQRRVIARVISDATDHPDVEELYRRSSAIDPKISIATVYRTVRLFEEAGILDRHDFGDGRARYEASPEAHHDQLIDVSAVDELRRGIADSVAVIFEHVGHVPMLEAPQATAEHHLALLARASRP